MHEFEEMIDWLDKQQQVRTVKVKIPVLRKSVFPHCKVRAN